MVARAAVFRAARRWRGVLALVLLTPVVVVSLVRLLFDPVAVLNAHRGEIEALSSAMLGRTLTVGSIEGHLYPEADVVIRDVVLGSVDGLGPPMAHLPEVRIAFQTREALWSFGARLPFASVTVRGGVLRLSRSPEGRFDI